MNNVELLIEIWRKLNPDYTFEYFNDKTILKNRCNHLIYTREKDGTYLDVLIYEFEFEE